ncbi:hypothetical protein H100_03848 [Trichophyton rubrum MR850]|nr:hypothetical protein H100_03848 [Trichophyton rubrum MR850]
MEEGRQRQSLLEKPDGSQICQGDAYAPMYSPAVHFSLPKESPEDDGEAVLPCSQKCDEVTAWCTDLYRQAVITTPAYIGW